ncbi:hypothetical protein DJ564_30185 [Pseudomonas sp. 31-12]|nr:hypothetical protein DJ564_30185 [Pseudomonas sp. 31-12]
MFGATIGIDQSLGHRGRFILEVFRHFSSAQQSVVLDLLLTMTTIPRAQELMGGAQKQHAPAAINASCEYWLG